MLAHRRYEFAPHSSDQALTATRICSHAIACKWWKTLWESVLRQECGQQPWISRTTCTVFSRGAGNQRASSEVVRLIEQLDLNEAIRLLAPSLYFQLINIARALRTAPATDSLLRHRIPTEAEAPSMPLSTELELQEEPLKGTLGQICWKKLAS